MLNTDRRPADRPARTTQALASLQPVVVRRWLRRPTEPWHRTVDGTVLSADISGFTRLAERSAERGPRHAAEALNTTINRCFEPMIDEIMDRGGDVLKFGGDAIFALFDGPDHRRQGAMAAATIQRRLEAVDAEIETKLSMTVGVASGPVGLILAGSGRRELVVHGPVVDECLRLESEAEPGEVLVSTETATGLPASWLDDADPDVVALVDLDPAELPRPASPVDHAGSGDDDPDAVDWVLALGEDLASAVDAFAGTAGEIRSVTVAFVHLPTRDLDARIVRGVVERADSLCRRHGATMLGTDVAREGVKLLLAAGAPTAGGRDEDAVLATLADLVLDPVAPPMRAGVNCGLVYAGFLGSPRCRTFTVMGDPTNLAARLLGKAEPRTVAVSLPVLENARSRYPSTELSPVLVKGRLAPVIVHRLEGPAAELRPRTVEPDLVGRESEMAELRAALDETRRGRGSLIEIVGEAGLGASRLIEHFVDGLPSGVLRFRLSGRLASGRPYAAVQPFLRAVAGIDGEITSGADGVSGTSEPGDSDGDRGLEALAAWVERTAPEMTQWLPLIAPAFGLEMADNTETESIWPEFRQLRTNRSIVSLLQSALSVATVPAVEDAHWLDPASIELCRAMARLCGQCPWLMITSTRPGTGLFGDDDQAEGAEDVSRRRLELGPLGLDEICQLVASIADLPHSRQLAVAQRAGGNPLFAIELARSAGTGADNDELRSIEGLVTARIDRLGHGARVLLRTTAVLGRRFEADLLGEVLEAAGDRIPIGDPVDLVQRVDGLIVDDGDGWYSFRSDVVHEIAYAGLSARRRRELHGLVAEALERRGADIAELAWHHDRAGNDESAWAYSRRSAERALRLGVMEEAGRYLRQALEAGERAGAEMVAPAAITEALTELFDVEVALKDYAGALAAGDRALERLDDPIARVRLLVRVASTRAEVDGSYGEQATLLERELAECPAGSEGAEARSWLGGALASVRYRRDELDGALAAADAAIRDAEEAGTVTPLPAALLIRQAVLADRSEPTLSSAGDDLIEAATAAGDDRILIAGHNNIGLDLQDAGDWAGALHHYELAIEVADRIGDGYRRTSVAINPAALLVDQGRWDEARPVLDELRRDATFHGSGLIEAWVKRELGRLEVHAGRPADGRPWLEAAGRWYRDAGIRSGLHEVDLLWMAADLADGRSQEVLDRATELEPMDEVVPRLLGRAGTLLGYALLQRGEPAAALEHLECAVTETEGRFLFGHALALVGRSEAEGFLGRGRTAKRTMADAQAILTELGVVALPVIPLPK